MLCVVAVRGCLRVRPLARKAHECKCAELRAVERKLSSPMTPESDAADRSSGQRLVKASISSRTRQPSTARLLRPTLPAPPRPIASSHCARSCAHSLILSARDFALRDASLHSHDIRSKLGGGCSGRHRLGDCRRIRTRVSLPLETLPLPLRRTLYTVLRLPPS